jgi:hypothetical protein
MYEWKERSETEKRNGRSVLYINIYIILKAKARRTGTFFERSPDTYCLWDLVSVVLVLGFCLIPPQICLISVHASDSPRF